LSKTDNFVAIINYAYARLPVTQFISTSFCPKIRKFVRAHQLELALRRSISIRHPSAIEWQSGKIVLISIATLLRIKQV